MLSPTLEILQEILPVRLTQVPLTTRISIKSNH